MIEKKNILGNIGRRFIFVSDKINMRDKYDDSIALSYYAPAFLRTVLSRGPPPSVISHRDNISPETWKGTQNYSTHLFRTENGGKGVYGNLSKLPKMSHRYDYFSVYFNIFS